ncbi:hypothetical protein L0F63_002349 [Massospora cicadina]|nr:hypothetical protein L0F63_002349 [Massospora cicadina]
MEVFCHAPPSTPMDHHTPLILGPIGPQDLCLTLLVVGMLKSQLHGQDEAEILNSPALIRFKREKRLAEIPFGQSLTTMGCCGFWGLGSLVRLAQQIHATFSSLREAVLTLEAEVCPGDVPAMNASASSTGGHATTPWQYLEMIHDIKDVSTDAAFLSNFYSVVSIQPAASEVDTAKFRDSEVGIFLREQAIRFECMRFESLVDLIYQTTLYFTEEPRDDKVVEIWTPLLTKLKITKSVDEQLEVAVARFDAVDSDFGVAFNLTLNNGTGSHALERAKLHFVSYLDQLLAGDYEASLGDFYPFAVLNFGILNYHFRHYGPAADFFIEMVRLAARTDHQTCLDLALYWIAKLSGRTDAPFVKSKVQRVLGANYHLQLLERLAEQQCLHAEACRSVLNYERMLQGCSPQLVLPNASMDAHGLWEHYGTPSLAYASNLTGKRVEHMLILAERLLDMGRVEASESLLRLVNSAYPVEAFSLAPPPWMSLELRLQFEKELAHNQLSKAQITLACLEDHLLEHRLLRPIVSIYQARLLSAQSNPSKAIDVLREALSDSAHLSYHRFLLYLALYELYMLRGSFTEAIPIAYAALGICHTGRHYGAWPTAALALADAMASSPDGFTDRARLLLKEVEDYVCRLRVVTLTKLKVPTSCPWYSLIRGKLELASFNGADTPEARKAHLESSLQNLQDAVDGFQALKSDPKLQVAAFLLRAAKNLQTLDCRFPGQTSQNG